MADANVYEVILIPNWEESLPAEGQTSPKAS